MKVFGQFLHALSNVFISCREEAKRSPAVLIKNYLFLLEIGEWKILEIGPVPKELVLPILENRILQVELRIIKILRYLLFLEEGIKDPGPII